MHGVQKVIYNLPNVLKASTVYFVEGEKCADAIINEGRVATTLSSGANSPWEPHYEKHLQNKEVLHCQYQFKKKKTKHTSNC